MRADAAFILVYLGFEVDIDFVASANEDGTVNIVWRSAQPQPTEAEIDAAAGAALAAKVAADALLTQLGIDKADLASQYAAGMTLLDNIAAATIPATFSNNTQRDAAIQQIAAAVKNLATIQRRMLKVVRALVI